MQESKAGIIKRTIFTFSLFILFGLIFTGLGYFILAHSQNIKNVCSEEVVAICTDFESTYTNNATNARAKKLTYTPVFSYTYNGKDYVSWANTYNKSFRRDFVINEEYTIFINPDNPKQFFNETINGQTKFLGFIFMGVGIFEIVLTIIILIIVLKNRLKNNNF